MNFIQIGGKKRTFTVKKEILGLKIFIKTSSIKALQEFGEI